MSENIRQTYSIRDDFSDASTSVSGAQGETGWQLVMVGSSTVSIWDYAGRVGVKRYTTASKTGSRITLTREVDLFRMDTVGWEMLFAIRYSNIDLAIIRNGFMNSFTGAQSELAYFEKKAADTNWFSVTKNLSDFENRIDTGVIADTAFHAFRIQKNEAGNWEFGIDGTLKTTHTTSLPLSVCAPAI